MDQNAVVNARDRFKRTPLEVTARNNPALNVSFLEAPVQFQRI